MATSGSIDYSDTRNDLIEDALRDIGALSEGETASAAAYTDASRRLNRLVKAWQADGLHIWAYQELVALLEPSEQSYSIGSTGDYVTLASDLVETTTSVAAVSGASTITLTSVTGIAASDYIAIVQDDGTLHKTTVSGAPAGLVVTLAAALTDDVASGNTVFAFTTKANRPPRITSVRLDISGNETPMNKMGREDYFNLPNKSASGAPTNYYYNPTLGNGTLYIWPTSQSAAYKARITAERSLEDFDAANNTPDFPQEWYLALEFNLAVLLAPSYGSLSSKDMAEIAALAAMYKDMASGFDREDASVVFLCDEASAW